MKRLLVIATALVACIALGSVALAAGGSNHPVKVKSKAKLKYSQSGVPPYDQSKFSGKVKGKKGCKKGRKVTVTRVGNAKTNKKGKYSISLGSAAPSGAYQARVKKKTIHKNGTKIVCKKAKSKQVRVS